MNTTVYPMTHPLSPLFPVWISALSGGNQQQEEIKEVKQEEKPVEKMSEGEKFITLEVFLCFITLLIIACFKE